MLHQIVSLLGALMILAAYFANQRRWIGPQNPSYSLLNLVGAGLLAWVAIVDQRVGFILLEITWALISIPPLVRAMRTNRPATG